MAAPPYGERRSSFSGSEQCSGKHAGRLRSGCFGWGRGEAPRDASRRGSRGRRSAPHCCVGGGIFSASRLAWPTARLGRRIVHGTTQIDFDVRWTMGLHCATCGAGSREQGECCDLLAAISYFSRWHCVAGGERRDNGGSISLKHSAAGSAKGKTARAPAAGSAGSGR